MERNGDLYPAFGARPTPAKMEWLEEEVRALRIKKQARIDADQHNRAVAQSNLALRSGKAPLMPLHNVYTNEPISPFPATVEELWDISYSGARKILEELGLQTRGDLALRRRRLIAAAGLGEM